MTRIALRLALVMLLVAPALAQSPPAAAPAGSTPKPVYQGGESEIAVGPEAPIVTFQPADASLLKPGATIFIVAQKQPDGTLTAARVTAEKDGVKPPM